MAQCYFYFLNLLKNWSARGYRIILSKVTLLIMLQSIFTYIQSLKLPCSNHVIVLGLIIECVSYFSIRPFGLKIEMIFTRQKTRYTRTEPKNFCSSSVNAWCQHSDDKGKFWYWVWKELRNIKLNCQFLWRVEKAYPWYRKG